MKILFLHLSDLHIQSKDSIKSIRIQALVESLASFSEFDGCVVVLSGDIASSGESNQYDLASKLLGQLKTEIMKQYRNLKDKDYKILLIPGNHDINYSGKRLPTCNDVKEALNDPSRDYFCEELDKMREYFNFSDGNGCFFSNTTVDVYNQAVTRKILHFSSEYRIEANLINTAPCSCKEDNGLHMLPDAVIPSLTRPSNADISIMVMHHSPAWFDFNQKKELERIISQRCSLAFYGHDHFPESHTITRDKDGAVIEQAGAVWWKAGSPNDSGYYAAIFDTQKLSYTSKEFTWDCSKLGYSEIEEPTQYIVSKPLNGKTMVYRDGYIQELLKDDKHNISDSISDYFVFPKLHINVSKEYTGNKNICKMQDLIRIVLSNKLVAITGEGNRGKTALLKMLFVFLRNEFITLYCGIDDISGRSQERIIKDLVGSTFGESAYSDFIRKPKEHKIIIIDDVHRISKKHLSKFLKGLEDEFEHIIFALEDDAKFDIVQMVKDSIHSNNGFVKLSIYKLFASKRNEIVEKIVEIKNKTESIPNCEITRSLEQYLNSYKLAFKTEIDFVVQFTEYYCSHLGELEKADATVFSKVFESSIERAIQPMLLRRVENVNDVVVALGEVAYYIHFNREYPITSEHINDVLSSYRDYYDNVWLTTDRFLEISEQSNLLVKTSDGYKYRFKSKDHLAYFVAKALNRKYYDNEDTTNLVTVVEQSGFGINSDILMFLTYIAENVRIPRLLLDQAIFFTRDWEEFSLDSKSINYLSGLSRKKENPPEPDQRERELIEQTEAEEIEDNIIETLDIYDYDIAQIDQLGYQLIRSFKQLSVISKCFSSFISILPASDKQNFVNAMYELPNKIFNQWATFVDKNIDALIEDIIKWQESDSSISKKADRSRVIKFFQDISLELLLNLYNVASSLGANKNTVDYLGKHYTDNNSTNHQIERLMFFERIDDYKAVINDAEKLSEKANNEMTRRMIVAIIRHMLIHSDRISELERKTTINKYFSSKGKTSILLERQKVLIESNG